VRTRGRPSARMPLGKHARAGEENAPKVSHPPRRVRLRAGTLLDAGMRANAATAGRIGAWGRWRGLEGRWGGGLAFDRPGGAEYPRCNECASQQLRSRTFARGACNAGAGACVYHQPTCLSAGVAAFFNALRLRLHPLHIAHENMHAHVHIHTCIHTYVHTYTHNIHTYVHAYIGSLHASGILAY
jgi:hypothetical protein